jgi:hypothetical protein
MMGQERVPDALADERAIARIVGVHGHGGVAEHGLDAGGGDHDLARAVLERVGEPVELAQGALLVIDLQIRERGPIDRAPVDQPLRAVEQPFLEEPHERLAHRARGTLVHGEAFALPVERRSQGAMLLAHALAVLLLPRPDAADELLAAEVVAAPAFLGAQIALHDHLRGDARVVGSRQPAGVEAAHPLVADEDVLQRSGEGMADVQAARDVGRRQHDRVRRLVARVLRVEEVVLFPEPHPVRFHGGRLVALVEAGALLCRFGCDHRHPSPPRAQCPSRSRSRIPGRGRSKR